MNSFLFLQNRRLFIIVAAAEMAFCLSHRTIKNWREIDKMKSVPPHRGAMHTVLVEEKRVDWSMEGVCIEKSFHTICCLYV